MRAPESIRLRELVAELMKAGGGHAEMESVLTMDAPLKATLAQIETGLDQGFGESTLADMVASAPAEKTA